MENKKLTIDNIKEKFWKVWYALQEMFSIAGYNIDKVYLFSEEKNWHRDALYLDKYEWTDKQENEFKNWLYTKLLESKEWRKWIMSLSIKKKKIIDKTIDQFVLAYWLKIKKEDSN